MFARYHFSAALKMIRGKNSRVSLCVQELSHPQDSLGTLATILISRIVKVSPCIFMVHKFIGFRDFVRLM